MLSLLFIFLLTIFILPGAKSYHIPSSAVHVTRGHPIDYYMGFGESIGYFPNMGAMNELMVGDKDGDGNRKPRQNCIFYVNQRPPMNDRDENWAKTRALQFAQMMNAQLPGGDYHTLYDEFDLEGAFGTGQAGPMDDALESGKKRIWFQVTSEAYANLCEGTVYLVTEAEEIWRESIWLTNELPAIMNSNGRVTGIVEIRPSDIGAAWRAGGNEPTNIPHHLYRGGQPPGANPRRDGKSEIPQGTKWDPNNNPTQKALDAIGNPEVSGDADIPGAEEDKPPSVCPGYNFGIIDLGLDNGTGDEGYAIVDGSCKQVAGARTKDVCTEPLFSCSPEPNQITELHLNDQNYACRSDPAAGRCPGVTVDVQFCCRNDGS